MPCTQDGLVSMLASFGGAAKTADFSPAAERPPGAGGDDDGAVTPEAFVAAVRAAAGWPAQAPPPAGAQCVVVLECSLLLNLLQAARALPGPVSWNLAPRLRRFARMLGAF